MLWNTKRLANADHLYGMAAECGLKWLMTGLGMKVDPETGTPLDRKDRVHADEIWKRYETLYREQREARGLPSSKPYPFENWHVSERYIRSRHFTVSHVKAHRNGAAYVKQLVTDVQDRKST